MQAILVGADPEVALAKNNSFVPCVGLIPGTKNSPLPIEGSETGLCLQEDGVSLEFNFKPVPVDEFRKHSALAYREVREAVNKFLGKEYKSYIVESAQYKEADLLTEQASTFGCDPDYLAHERGMMRKPVSAKAMGNMRCFAGHIHIGYDKSKCPTPDWAIVQGMEAFGYLFEVVAGMDPQPGRRKFYGLPGLYRPKEYGLEYRTPTNYWLNDPSIAARIAETAQHIINKPAAFQQLYQLVNWKTVQTCILSNGQEYRGTWLDDMADLRDKLFNAPVEE